MFRKKTNITSDEHLSICRKLSCLSPEEAKTAIATLLESQTFHITEDVCIKENQDDYKFLLPASGVSLDISDCKNISHLPAMQMSGSVAAGDSGVVTADTGLVANLLDLSGCNGFKHVPAFKVKRVFVRGSGVESADPGIVADELHLTGCHSLKHIPAFTQVKRIFAAASGVRTYAPGLKTRKISVDRHLVERRKGSPSSLPTQKKPVAPPDASLQARIQPVASDGGSRGGYD